MTSDEAWREVDYLEPFMPELDGWNQASSPYPPLTLSFCVEAGAPRVWCGSYPNPEVPDPDGTMALQYGSWYYAEAMEHQSASEHDVRVQCFQAAELLYLHAAGHGNAQALANLGYVYSYDRCEGAYWMRPSAAGDGGEDPGSAAGTFPREERAFTCYLCSAEAGVSESCYKVGDLHRLGMGCERDLGAAFRWYRRGYELGSLDEDALVCGASALRLARAYEDAEGVGRSCEQALLWYERAEKGLDAAVEHGAWFYEKSLASARSGVARMRQELSGEY